MSYTGWLLPDKDRAKLMAVFQPHYHEVLAHHITLGMGELPLPLETHGKVVGVTDDGLGVQALVISLNGSVKRPDGKIWHITWSIDRDNFKRKPVHSNDVLAKLGWVPLETPIEIDLVPTFFPD